MFRHLIEAYQAAKLRADVKFGRKTWGRQTRHATISIKVIRADGSVEDMGVVSEGDIIFRPEAKSK